ncbi:MAG: hypothetical protein KDA41_18550, partial [Planctomycetales bacterium]|nr:hypothetical protein [Planctomycetales bacterium]
MRTIYSVLISSVLFLLAFSVQPETAWGQIILTTENFEGGATGWADNTTTVEVAPWTEFLGRFSNPAGQQQFKTFSGLPVGPVIVNVQFDFYRIDSWDGENFEVYIDDVIVANDKYQHNTATETPPNAVALGPKSNVIFSGWSDQRFQYNFTTTVTDGDIKLGFGDTINSGISDESWGIDNLEISYLISSGDLTWDSGATADWSSVANWDDGAPPPSTTPAAGKPTNTESAFVPQGTVNVSGNEAAFSLDIGNTLPTGSPLVDVNAGGTLTVAAGAVIGAAGGLNVNGDLVTGSINSAAGSNVNLNNGGSLTTGGGVIDTLTQAGTATLNGGGVTITNLTAGTQLNGTSDFTASNTITSGSTFNQTAGTATLGNVSGSGGLTKGGGGTVLLNTSNTYTGVTTVNQGTLTISNATALGTTGAGTTVANGASLQLTGGGNFNISEPLTITGGGNGVSD